MKTPEAEIGRSFDVHSNVLSNGLRVLLVENPAIPAISINGISELRWIARSARMANNWPLSSLPV